MLIIFLGLMGIIVVLFCVMHCYIKFFKATNKKFRLINKIIQYTPPFIPKAPASDGDAVLNDSRSNVFSEFRFLEDINFKLYEFYYFFKTLFV